MVEKIKSAYILWHGYHDTFPKTHKYSLGNRIDKAFIELLEGAVTASFLPKEEKASYIRFAIRKLDLICILLLVSLETNSLSEKRYLALSTPLYEAGKMLGGWYGQLTKQNSPPISEEK